jgi:hypothetical protein
MAQVTLDQRRLEQLRRQLYGKEQGEKKSGSKAKSQETLKLDSRLLTLDSSKKEPVNHQEVSYLRTDLLKIAILAALAIAAQAGLYIATQMKLIHLGL